MALTVRGRGPLRPLAAIALPFVSAPLPRGFVSSVEQAAARWDEAVARLHGRSRDELRATPAEYAVRGSRTKRRKPVLFSGSGRPRWLLLVPVGSAAVFRDDHDAAQHVVEQDPFVLVEYAEEPFLLVAEEVHRAEPGRAALLG